MAQTQTIIRPWHLAQKEQPSILERLERVNRERGHFRELIAATLQEEVVKDGGLQLSDSDEEESEDEDRGDGEEDATTQPVRREELYKVKMEMLQKVALAHNEIMMALDFVSLVESKDSAMGRQTISQFLKDAVPAGTLGVDLWQRMPVDRARDERDTTIAHNIRLEGIQKSADDILNAAKRLESKVRKETTYWNELLSITNKGWPLCRLPGQRGKLGVRFGFSESTAEFSRAGIAPLVANAEGNILLGRETELRSRTGRITVRDGDEILGSSSPLLVNDDDNIEHHIKHARDSLFDEELFREAEREGRATNGTDVHLNQNGIIFPISDGERILTVQFELQTHEQACTTVSGSSFHDFMAQGILTTLRLLLCQAHRDHLNRRSAIPPPLTDARADRPLFQLLRPVFGLSLHNQTIKAINTQLDHTRSVLELAGLRPRLLHAAMKTSPSSGELDQARLNDELAQLRSSEAQLQLTSGESQVVQSNLIIRVDTLIIPDCSTRFTIELAQAQSSTITSIERAIWRLDEYVSRLVASVLIRSHPGWQLDAVNALMTSSDGNQAAVKFDSRDKSLTLRTRRATRTWRLGETIEHGDIVSAWNALVDGKTIP